MSTAGRPESSTPDASDVATRLREAEFVRLVGAADGDALAALGLVAGALDEISTPYQATVSALPDDATRTTEADLTVAFGRPVSTADITVGLTDVASTTAYDVATDLGTGDAMLALAGIVSAGAVPEGRPLDDAESLDRRPGIATPTTDTIDALAHSTLVHGPFSGTVESAGELVSDVTTDTDAETRRRIASLVALAVAGDETSTPHGAEAVERALRPHVGGPFETIEGYADVLDAVARTDPGLAVALVLGGVDCDTALAVWREHGQNAHNAVRSATTGRYDGLFVLRCDEPTPVGTVARLAADFRSPEPVVLVVADGEAAVVGRDDSQQALDIGHTVSEAANAVDGVGAGTPARGRARFDADDTEFVVAFREAQ